MIGQSAQKQRRAFQSSFSQFIKITSLPTLPQWWKKLNEIDHILIEIKISKGLAGDIISFVLDSSVLPRRSECAWLQLISFHITLRYRLKYYLLKSNGSEDLYFPNLQHASYLCARINVWVWDGQLVMNYTPGSLTWSSWVGPREPYSAGQTYCLL